MKTGVVRPHDEPHQDGAWFSVCLLRNLLKLLPLWLEAILLAWLCFLLPGPLAALWGGVGALLGTLHTLNNTRCSRTLARQRAQGYAV
jgi:hypothetical protein